MTIVKAPLHSFQAQASLGPDLCYKFLSGQHVAQKRPTPTDPNSLAQNQRRFVYYWWSHVWHYMTTLERAAYTPPRHIKHLSPYNYFMAEKLKIPFGLYIYLPFDDDPPYALWDPYNRVIAAVNYGGITNPGIVNKAVKTDGLDDWGLLSINTTGWTAITLVAWLKIWAYDKNSTIIGCHSAGYGTDGPALALYNAHPQSNLHTSLGNYFYVAGNFTAFYHHALVYNGAVAQTWLNNAIDDQAALTGTVQPLDLTFRYARDFTSPSYYCEISIDEFYLFNRALSAQEIRMLYNDRQTMYWRP